MNIYTECEIQAVDIQRNVLGKEVPIYHFALGFLKNAALLL